MSSPQMASSPSRSGLLSQWWSRVRPERDQAERGERPPLLSTHSSSAVMQSSRLTSPQPPDGLWVINGGQKVQVPPEYIKSPIFGVPLQESIKYASVQISLCDSRGNEFVYGYVPVVAAKCSSFLKQNGQTVRGIFRLSGSLRRINLLQELFNTAPKFGKDVDWSGFTVHDAANILRRFFTQLPEPVVPHSFYDAFRAPLEGCPEVLEHLRYKAQLVKTSVESGKDEIQPVPSPPRELVAAMVEQYERLLFKLPPVNLHLFVYLLDLMDVFESMSEENLMPAFNLATIFLMSMLPVPENDLESSEFQLSRLVLVFLIENSSEILARVREAAVQEHELRQGVSASASNLNLSASAQGSANISDPSASTHEANGFNDSTISVASGHPGHPSAVPPITVSPENDSTPSIPSTPSVLQVEKRQTKTHNIITADNANDPIPYSGGRKHSKSMSSAAPPQPLLKSHRDSFITSLRRQMSNSRRRESARDISGSLSTGSTASLNTTASPSSMTSDENQNLHRRSWLGRKR